MKAGIAVFGAIIFLALAGTLKADDKAKWHVQLQLQLLSEKQCELIYTTNAFERELGGVLTVSGRAHCRDNRQFDFNRISPEKPFELRNCQPVVC